MITYTPETYAVYYGQDETQLNIASNAVIGTTDVTAVNQVYSTTIDGLQSNTTYYYQIMATNSVGQNKSTITQLVTSLPSKLYISVL